MSEIGATYFITGLSGAGKTTVGKEVLAQIKKTRQNVVFMDGDLMRKAYNDDIGYSAEERLKGAMRNCRLCRLLNEQGLDVVCCMIAMIDSVREWNRKNIENYVEIYLKVPLDVLKKRDQKGIYSGFAKGKVGNIVGLDIPVSEPKHPDIVIINDGATTPGEAADIILSYKKESK